MSPGPTILKMKTDAGVSEYELGRNIVKTLPEAVSGLNAVLFADNRLRDRLDDLPPSLPVVFLKGGESIKTMAGLQTIYDHLRRCGVPRDGLLIAVGGGTILDLCGLAASTWGRGLDFIAVPTTLLAAVDASVGGKTGINLGELKNPVGTFHPARRILVQPDLLYSLPRREWRNGMAEMIKTAVIGSAALFRDLEAHADDLTSKLADGDPRRRVAGIDTLPWQDWLAAAAAVKMKLVEKDFREHGPRRALNLGHTLGHALELSQGLDHGQAVALGLAAVSRLAAAQNTCTTRTADRIIGLLENCGLPTTLRPENKQAVVKLVERDKKTLGERVGWVLPVRPGRVLIDQAVDTKTALDHLAERRI
jgi:3-dehydroquinate synthase